MSKKSYPYLMTLIIGLVMIAVSLLTKDDVPKSITGGLIGVGVGLMGMSLSCLTNIRYIKKHPSAAKQAEIETNDERNVLIRAHAKAAAADVIHWFIIALAFVMIFLDAPLWIVLSVVAVYTLYHVLTFLFVARFQKQM